MSRRVTDITPRFRSIPRILWRVRCPLQPRRQHIQGYCPQPPHTVLLLVFTHPVLYAIGLPERARRGICRQNGPLSRVEAVHRGIEERLGERHHSRESRRSSLWFSDQMFVISSRLQCYSPRMLDSWPFKASTTVVFLGTGVQLKLPATSPPSSAYSSTSRAKSLLAVIDTMKPNKQIEQ